MPYLFQLFRSCKTLRAGFVLFLAGIGSALSTTPMPADETDTSAASGEWIALFDGTSLDAWRGYKQESRPDGWVIEDGVLVRRSGGGDLMTVDQFGDFELQLQWKISEGGNSGIIYRVTNDLAQSYLTGPEYQILDDARHADGKRRETSAGSLYALYPAPEGAARPVGEWNETRIVVRGNHIEHWLNGTKTADAEIGSEDWKQRVADSKFRDWDRFASNKQGHIVLQDHGDLVWFRDVRVRRLPATAATPKRAARLLFVTQSKGFRHGAVTRSGDQLSPAEQVMTELGVSTGLFRAECTQDCERDFTREKLDSVDIVMFYTTGDLPISEELLEYFLQTWLKQPGHGFIGVHSAADTYHNYKPYWDMLGGTFHGHPWGAGSTVTITVHDQQHPISRVWGKEFTLQDEIYRFKNWQPEKVRVLMSLNMAKTDLKEPYHVPIAWVKNYGEGKVAHMSLGHREDVWTNPTYQESLAGAVRWILGLEPGDATPNPELSAQQEELARQVVEKAKAQ